MQDELIKGLDSMGRAVGIGGLARAVLGEHQAPDPVIPPDLHLVRPALADAEGNVQCLYCGRAVKWEAAQMVGSAGYECGKCQHAYNHEAPLALDTPLRRRLWPWAVGASVFVIGGAIGIWQYLASKERARFEEEYPIVATDAELEVIEKNLDRWNDDNLAKLVIAVDNPPAIKTLTLGAACDVDVTKAIQFRSDKDSKKEIEADVRVLVREASRGRFSHPLDRLRAVGEIAAPVLAFAYHEEREAKLETTEGEATFHPGVRAGTAHVFDTDGTLLCAGVFEAGSSDRVGYTRERYDFDADQEMRELTADDRDAARRSLSRDLEGQTWKAIVGSLKKVR